MNLSLFLPGLGQVYCGAFRRGILQLCGPRRPPRRRRILPLATQSTPPATLLITVLILSIIPTAYSAWDARRMALSSREDYRLKDYNRVSVYVAISFLVMPQAVPDSPSPFAKTSLHVFGMAGNSMSPTIKEGDRIFVRKDSYRDRQPEHNDLVAFLNPA
jgi:hypothetical protein